MKTKLIFCGILVALQYALSWTPASAAEPEVTTIAGTGALGMADGPARKATFIYPDGVAIAKDGSIYVSDRDAQRIRVLTPQGIVKTVAGSGAIEKSPGMSVPGKYADGPALNARFWGPGGIAFGPDGGLYIADAYNRCIRKLLNGKVTTVLGFKDYSGAAPTAVDGDIKTGRLMHPQSLTFDEAGNMYIADNGGGLRKFDTSGNLTTIHLHDYVDPKFPNAVAYVPDQSDPVVLVTSRDGLFIYHTATGKDEGFAARGAFEGDLPMGDPNQLAVQDRRQIYYTDLMTNSINYLRLPARLFAGKLFARAVAGSTVRWPAKTAGFANGDRYTARFYDPMAIALMNGSAIVADGGNRRIRKMLLPHTTVSEAGLDPANVVDDRHYEVALVGASWTFWDTLGGDSICAAIERTLNRSHRFEKPVRCHTVRIDAAVSDQDEDYIKNVFPYERMDLVILDAESWYIQDPDYPKGGTTWGADFRKHMQSLLDVLTPLHTKLALVHFYTAYDVGNAEFPMEDNGTPRGLPTDIKHATAARMMAVLKGMPIYQYDMYPDITAYEKSINALPLYQPYDPHPSATGNLFFGTHFAQGLLNAGLGKM